MKNKPIIINAIVLLCSLFISTINYAKQVSWQSNYKQPEYFTKTINNQTKDLYQEIITPESDLITGFLIEINNHNIETSIKYIENAYINYFNLHKIEIKNIISTASTNVFYLEKNIKDKNFYTKFSKVVSWFMLNRRDTSVTIRPIVKNQDFIASRAILLDKPQVITHNTKNNFLDPETTIIDGYHIHMDFLPGQDKKAQLLFNQFKDYISTQRLIYSDLDWYPENSNGPHARAGWEIKFEKAGSQLMSEYGKALMWLLLNHGDIPIYSHSKNWVFGENENRLISHLDHCLYSGAKPKVKQQFFYNPENKNSGLYRWDQQLANSRIIAKHDSKLKQQEILDFNFDPKNKDKAFSKQDSNGTELDQIIKKKYLKDIFLAVNGYYDDWLETPKGKLSYIILLDQFPRCIFRGTPMIVAYDKLSLKVAKSIVKAGEDKNMSYEERIYCYLPFVHSESVEEQKVGVELFKKLKEEVPAKLKSEFEVHYKQAVKHKLVIDNFGRFLHRDKALFGIKLTQKEIDFLKKHDATF